jgi:KUP system potassium uptake protein
MRAHNRGDGGGMALAALIQRRQRRPHDAAGHARHLRRRPVLRRRDDHAGDLGDLRGRGAEGRQRRARPPRRADLAGDPVGLFAVQRYGTGAVGWLFGPLILVWFVVIGVLGGARCLAHPGVLQGLSPSWGARFMIDHGVAAFLTLGGVVLAVTGAEALYADRGHFGAMPIRRTWFGIVFPAVLLSYLGQGALILAHPHTITTRSTCWFPAEADSDGVPRHSGNDHRFAGGDHRVVLDRSPGRATRLPAAAEDHCTRLSSRGRSTCR